MLYHSVTSLVLLTLSFGSLFFESDLSFMLCVKLFVILVYELFLRSFKATLEQDYILAVA
jgi:hypothetical protein